MNKKKRVVSYRAVMTASFVALNITVVLTLLVFNFRYTYNLLIQNVGGSIVNNLDVATQSIQSDMASYKSMVQFLAWDQEVIDAMARDMKNYPERNFADTQRLYTITTSMMANLPKRLPLHLINHESHISLFSTTNYYAPYYRTSKQDFFQRIDQSGHNTVVAQPHWRVDGAESLNVCYSLGALIVQESEPVGYVVLDIYEYYFQQVLDSVQLQIPELQDVLVMDEDGIVLTDQSGRYRIGARYDSPDILTRPPQNGGIPLETANGPMLAYHGRSDDSALHIVATLPRDYFWKATLYNMRVFLPLAAVSLGLGILMSVWLSSIVSDPIRKLTRAFTKINEGDLSVQVGFANRKTEIGLLGRNFNDMASSLERLIEQDYKKSLLLQEAELNLLKSQINPHFLYNCMNMINMTARLGKNEETAAIAMALGQFYRYIMKDLDREVTVAEEILQIENYLAIYKIRYPDRLTVEIDIAPDAMECTIMKMLLQPLVENAMVHGIEQTVGPGVLRITARRQGDDLLVEVLDNGPGSSNHSGQNIGMENVRRRIALYYGPKHYVTMARREGFTVVSMLIAARRAAPEQSEEKEMPRDNTDGG